jgi:CheY-like chemotaxis protein
MDQAGDDMSSAEGKAAEVLVVHGSDGAFSAIEEALSALGHTAKRARDGVEALALLRQLPFDLVLIDVAIQKPYAYELVRDLKAAHLPPRVVLLAAIHDQKKYYRPPTTLSGADDYLEEADWRQRLPAVLAAAIKKEGA